MVTAVVEVVIEGEVDGAVDGAEGEEVVGNEPRRMVEWNDENRLSTRFCVWSAQRSALEMMSGRWFLALKRRHAWMTLVSGKGMHG